jgi:hypothetical protein
MPKTYPKSQSKKSKSKKMKTQPKPASLTTRKSYWVTLVTIVLVFSFVYGYLMKISLEKEALILGSILSIICFAFYIGFKPSTNYSKRATFIFVGASIVGFSLWTIMVLSLNAIGMQSQITDSIGEDFFAITSLMICLIIGAFVGDLIGKNRENLNIFR